MIARANGQFFLKNEITENMSCASVIGKIFGSKSERDYKAVKPTLDKILAVYPEIDALSDDGLRARSAALRARLQEVEKPFEDRIAEIKLELDKDIPISEKEKLAGESDKLVKDEDEAIEKCLDEILPEAFAIVKSTARRFKENASITVTATQFDRDLSVNHDFVTIDGDREDHGIRFVFPGKNGYRSASKPTFFSAVSRRP